MPRSILNIILFFTFGVHGKFLEEFSFGMMVSACYVYAQHPEVGGAFKARFQRLSVWLWALGLLVLLCAALWLGNVHVPAVIFRHTIMEPFEYPYNWFAEPIASVGYSLCVCAILFGPRGLRWFFETRLLRWIGLLSFGLYMWHQKLLSFFDQNDLPYLPHMRLIFTDIANWVWISIVVIPLCYILYRTIEAPGIRLGTFLVARQSPAMPENAMPLQLPSQLTEAASPSQTVSLSMLVEPTQESKDDPEKTEPRLITVS